MSQSSFLDENYGETIRFTKCLFSRLSELLGSDISLLVTTASSITMDESEVKSKRFPPLSLSCRYELLNIWLAEVLNLTIKLEDFFKAINF
jgi:hypothetical protein